MEKKDNNKNDGKLMTKDGNAAGVKKMVYREGLQKNRNVWKQSLRRMTIVDEDKDEKGNESYWDVNKKCNNEWRNFQIFILFSCP